MSASPQSQTYQSPMMSHAEDRHTPLSTHRRQASTGGGRAWSEEEESYLIETRMHKMPYKHIAAHLQKTELACRLHYHQLSFGTKRRRRNSSISSVRSTTSSGSSSIDPIALPQRTLPALSPPASPESLANTRSPSPHDPVPILPKPSVDLGRSMTPQNSSLRLITEDIERFEERSRVNKDRLARIYDAHRSHFWGMIARDYGDNISPAALEDVWHRHNSAMAHYPPTPPNRSPEHERPATGALGPAFIDIKASQGFNPVVNMPRSAPSLPTGALPSRGSFAIASLLTEDKDVRSPVDRR